MLITINDIRAIRPVAMNINDERIEPYIYEAEMLDIHEAIGGDLYKKLDEKDNLTEELETMLEGGYYSDHCGVEHKFAGLKVATAYLAYARFIRNNQTNITPYGVVVKMGEESTTSDYRTVAAQAAEAENIGRAMLAEAIRYWRCVHECSDIPHIRRKRFVAIGR